MLDFGVFSGKPRILLSVDLRPVQGHRFQPTGFPDLGAATYTCPHDQTEMLLVESPQSMANRLEMTAWDPVTNDLVPVMKGLPYVRVSSTSGKFLTSSILEAHRLNSPYFLDSLGGTFLKTLKSELESDQKGDEPEAVDLRKASGVIFKYDPNSLLHGLFLSGSKQLAGGRYRFVRLLSAFIEAENVNPVESGGVKNDRVNPSGDTRTGYGNVPFHRTEYVASKIRAHFAIDLSTLRSYGLGEPRENLLLGLALWKIRALLDGTLRLRTACDLIPERPGDIVFTEPYGLTLPSLEDLCSQLPGLIEACEQFFAKPAVTSLEWSTGEARKLAPERMKREDKDNAD